MRLLAISALLGIALGHVESAAAGPSFCAEGLKNFPFLKSWASKLENFATPIEVDNSNNSQFYALGAVFVSKDVLEPWKSDRALISLESKGKKGKLETHWLGALPKDGFPHGRQSDSAAGLASPALTASFISDDQGWGKVAALFFQASERDLLSDCGTNSCKIKFNDPELKQVIGGGHLERLERYRAILNERIKAFQKNGEIRAYERTSLSLGWQDQPLPSFFPSDVSKHFWLPKTRDHFGYDCLDAEPGKHKPVTALYSRECEKRGEGAAAYTACTDLVLYNNHYFDFWARMAYFFPWCNGQIVLLYETLDVDQIKDSKIVRVLFGNQMRQSLGNLVETRLKRLRVLSQ